MKKEHSRRWDATERKLEDAALALMNASGPEHITVRAVCERAGVNRSTFYDHFLDVYDLFDKLEAEMRRGIRRRYDPDTAEAFTMDSFIPMLTHIKENQSFYRAVLRTRNRFPIETGFARILEDVVRPACEKAGVTEESRVMYCLVFFQAGFTMCLRRWVEGGCRESESELAALMAACVPDIFSGPGIPQKAAP